MGKKQRLTTKTGKKVSPNVSVKTRVNAALADFKEGKQGITKKSISRRHGVAVSLLNRYIKQIFMQIVSGSIDAIVSTFHTTKVFPPKV